MCWGVGGTEVKDDPSDLGTQLVAPLRPTLACEAPLPGAWGRDAHLGSDPPTSETGTWPGRLHPPGLPSAQRELGPPAAPPGVPRPRLGRRGRGGLGAAGVEGGQGDSSSPRAEGSGASSSPAPGVSINQAPGSAARKRRRMERPVVGGWGGCRRWGSSISGPTGTSEGAPARPPPGPPGRAPPDLARPLPPRPCDAAGLSKLVPAGAP